MLLGGLSTLKPVIEYAHKHNYWVITCDYLPENPAHQWSDEYHNVSIIDKEAVLALAQKLDIDGIMSFAVDPGVVTAAYVAEQMGLPFQCSYESACILQNKGRFRQFLRDNGFNTPRSKAYTNLEEALGEIDTWTFPVVVKPTDSAGSKGVSRVDKKSDFETALEFAKSYSLSQEVIVEDFLELQGFQSNGDCFAIDGEFTFVTFSDDYFDERTENQFYPIFEIYPASMPTQAQEDFTRDLNRLAKLLGLRTGIFNIETRFCTDNKGYILEISPRGGGDDLALLEDLATKNNLIEAEVCKAVGDPLPEVKPAEYDAWYTVECLYSLTDRIFQRLDLDEAYAKKHLCKLELRAKSGDKIERMSKGSEIYGTMFRQFSTYEEASKAAKERVGYKMVLEES